MQLCRDPPLTLPTNLMQLSILGSRAQLQSMMLLGQSMVRWLVLINIWYAGLNSVLVFYICFGEPFSMLLLPSSM